MKYAMTLDGKIATVTGASKWITGKLSRTRVHQDRHRYAAIMVGVGTVLSDDPSLTCRIPNGHNPIRIICDTTLKTPLTAQVVQTAKTVPTIIATSSDDAARITAFEQAGCDILIVPKYQHHGKTKKQRRHLRKAGMVSTGDYKRIRKMVYSLK